MLKPMQSSSWEREALLYPGCTKLQEETHTWMRGLGASVLPQAALSKDSEGLPTKPESHWTPSLECPCALHHRGCLETKRVWGV